MKQDQSGKKLGCTYNTQKWPGAKNLFWNSVEFSKQIFILYLKNSNEKSLKLEKL